MPRFRVVLVEPKHEGNVGSVARVMKNFGQTELVLVKAPALGDIAQGRAMHAWDVVQAAARFEHLEQALQGCDYVVGTSARIPHPDKTYLRNPIEAHEFPKRVENTEGTIALVFGREDFGLSNEELEFCDLLVTIPTSDMYRSLNLSQAVGILLYEVFLRFQKLPALPTRAMSEQMRHTFHAAFDRLIEAMDLPRHKEKNTKTLYRKVFGRAVPSAWEYYVFMGILKQCLARFGHPIPATEEPPMPDPSEDGTDVASDALPEAR